MKVATVLNVKLLALEFLGLCKVLIARSIEVQYIFSESIFQRQRGWMVCLLYFHFVRFF